MFLWGLQKHTADSLGRLCFVIYGMTRNKIEYEISPAPNVGGHGHTSLSLVRIEIMGSLSIEAANSAGKHRCSARNGSEHAIVVPPNPEQIGQIETNCHDHNGKKDA